MTREENSKPEFGYYEFKNIRTEEFNFSLHEIYAFRAINLDENKVIMVYSYLGNDSYYHLNIVNTDDGNNWSDPIEIDRLVKDDHSHIGKIILQKTGNEIYCYYWFLPTEYMVDAIFKVIKTIDGTNWTAPEIITERIEKAEYDIEFPEKFNNFGWTSIDEYEVHQINKELFFMAIDFEGYGTDTTFGRGTFFSYSFDGKEWSDIIKISYVGNIWLSGISIVQLKEEIHIIYFDFDYDEITDKVISIDKLTKIEGPIYDYGYPVYDDD
jgi:hypothetical protein